MAKNGALLWTGGKDCMLAYCRAREAGIRIRRFVTFFPEGNEAAFKAHPIERLRELARAANVAHELLPVTAPYRESYVAGLAMLKKRRTIEAVVTGDIDFVDAYPNWIRECAADAGLGVEMPLWQCPRLELLNEIVARGIRARISWISSPHIPASWLGRAIDRPLIEDLRALAARVEIDICGENGEYHTMVERIPL